MMQTIALAILVLSSVWLVAVAALMVLRPAWCIHLLGLMASTHRINLTEQGLRMTAGAALIVRAPESKLPLLFEAGGWFIVATSILLSVLPLRWHAAYAIWWSRQLTPGAVRALSPHSAVLGAGLVYVAL
jgi:hypothetical protein